MQNQRLGGEQLTCRSLAGGYTKRLMAFFFGQGAAIPNTYGMMTPGSAFALGVIDDRDDDLDRGGAGILDRDCPSRGQTMAIAGSQLLPTRSVRGMEFPPLIACWLPGRWWTRWNDGLQTRRHLEIGRRHGFGLDGLDREAIGDFAVA